MVLLIAAVLSYIRYFILSHSNVPHPRISLCDHIQQRRMAGLGPLSEKGMTGATNHAAHEQEQVVGRAEWQGRHVSAIATQTEVATEWEATAAAKSAEMEKIQVLYDST